MSFVNSGRLLCFGATMTLGVGLLAAKPSHSLDAQLTHPLISAREARPLIEAGEVDVIDARDLKVQLWVGHLPGALHLPWRALTKGKRDGTLIEDHALIRRLDELGLTPSRPIVIYAGWSSGWGEEARALWSLEYAGHSRVQVIEGGWEAWREAGGTRAFGRPAQRLTRRTEATQAERLAQWKTRPELRVTTDEVDGLLRAGWRALDTRAEREYNGNTPYGSPVGGHLTGAQHLDWSTLLDGARLLGRDALLARFKAVGVTPETRSFVYCTGGVRSAFVYLALRSLGAREVRNYDGSWWAWSRQLSSSQP